MGPINTHDAATAAHAYTQILGWPITLGHRYRPRKGCTCDRLGCTTPGAHPRHEGLAGRPRDLSDQDIEAAAGAALIATTAAFDALVLPRQVGMALMTALERIAPVPCLTDATRAALAVLPATGRYALGGQPSAAVDLRTGPRAWLALPPSHSTRWDTPPWNDQTHTPLPLLHGADLRSHLAEALAHESQTVRRQS